MVEALGGFDPKATYDAASRAYEDASRDYWQYLSTRTVDRVQLRAGERVLDVPCGTGPSLVAAAERVGPTGRVVGVDYADQMLAIAREKVRSLRLDNVEIHIGDMTSIAPPDEPFDAVVCVLGVFFADDMPGLIRSFRELVRSPGGRIAVTVFGEQVFEPMRDVFIEAVRELDSELEVVQPWQRTQTASLLRGIFEDAGISDVTIETDDDKLALPSAEEWWRIVMGSGLRRTVAALGEEKSAAVRRRCDAHIEEHGVNELVMRSRYAVAVLP